MWTTKKLHSEMKKFVKKEFGNVTRYRIAQLLDCAQNTVKNWENGGVMEDEIALKLSTLLDLDADYVLICLAAERNKGKSVAERWERMAEQLKPAIAASFAASALLFVSVHDSISPFVL